MTTYYKAVRPDGTDFRTGEVQWAPPEGHQGEWIVRHPTATMIGADASGYLSVSTDPTDLPGAEWPMRLLVVEPAGETGTDDGFYPNKVTGVAFRHVTEVGVHLRFGPMGEHVVALLDRASRLRSDEVKRLHAAWDAARATAWAAARDAAWDAARATAWDAAWGAARATAGAAARDAARAAAWALVIRDLIGRHGFTQAHYDALTGPWRKLVGPIHPDDAEVSA